MSKKIAVLVIWLSLVSMQMLGANYSFRVIAKHPFVSRQHYDSLGNVVFVDSLARFIPVRAIIFKAETESLYHESATNDSGYATFTFDNWQDNVSITVDNITQMTIDFPNTDRVIRTDGKITFEHLKYPDVDFRKSPEEIEIILPMTVTKDEFRIGNTNWINSYNFAVMNDMHIGDGYTDFGTNQWNDDTIANQSNAYIQNNENIVAAINTLSPDFVVVLGDITNSVEKSELKKAKAVLSRLEVPYIPIMGNHDTRPYTDDDGEAGIPGETYFGKYFYDAFAEIYNTNALQFANWGKGPYFSTVSPPDYNTYYLNSAFNYQNYQFINVDYNTRRHAQWPIGYYGTQPDADVGPPPEHLYILINFFNFSTQKIILGWIPCLETLHRGIDKV